MERPELDWIWILSSLGERYKVELPELDQVLKLLDEAGKRLYDSPNISIPDSKRLFEVKADMENWRSSR